MRNAEWKKEAKNSEFHIPNSEFSNARWARLFLRKHGGISGENSFPADLFPRNSFFSGPQACFSAGRRIAGVKGGAKSPLFDPLDS